MSTDHERPRPLPRPITGVFVRHLLHTACPRYFAMVWADFEPLRDDGTGEAFAFVDDLPDRCREPGEPLPKEFVRAFTEGAREVWENSGGDRPLFAARVVLRDAVWHDNDSNPQSFRMAGRLAAREALCCVAEGREPRQAGRSGRSDSPIPPMPRTLPPPDPAPPA
ncbi:MULTISPECIES: hypothetical protein [Nocardiopsis]|uniref:Translation elongation factor EFG/EF2 domain-containing protein n=1 Tax=Nocardiopsis sinuspersici TaxID=501010 RepID=A0A1V3C0D4_9ACTN|nr:MULTISPECIES: hypothetical protein [Nocardiopsis]OOC54264.1 hypothetical protein NOSIN_10985 [Nocardiopsis sinuspersici]